MSVSKVLTAGNRVVFDNAIGFIESKKSGEKTWLCDKEGMAIFKM